MSLSFQFRLIPSIAALLLICTGLSLAQWQTRRAEQREQVALQREQAQRVIMPLNSNLHAAIEPYTQLRVRGEFVADWPLYLDNRPLHGVSGRYLLMPFRIADSNQYVLVARGWQARDPQDRLKLAPVPLPQGEIEIIGTARSGFDHVMQLGQPEPVRPGALLQNISAAEVAQASGKQFLSIMLEQTSDSADGLQRDWVKASSGAEKNRAYAFQWLALSLMVFIFYVVTGIRRGQQAANN